MSKLKLSNKKKSAVITASIILVLIYIIFNFGMKYLDPPIEYGVAINFGNSSVGKGDFIDNNKSFEQVKEETNDNETIEEQKNEPNKEIIEDEYQENKSDKVIEENIITKKNADYTIKKQKKKQEEKNKVVKEKQKKKIKPKPSKTITDALNSLLNSNSSKKNNKGEGDDNRSGLKGKKTGNSSSRNFYGKGGYGSGGNYRLNGRKALFKPKEKPNCEEVGVVVVRILVNNKGKVIKAIPGERGTTNAASCLFKAAKKAALSTEWNADSKAAKIQSGFIIYKFSLSK